MDIEQKLQKVMSILRRPFHCSMLLLAIMQPFHASLRCRTLQKARAAVFEVFGPVPRRQSNPAPAMLCQQLLAAETGQGEQEIQCDPIAASGGQETTVGATGGNSSPGQTPVPIPLSTGSEPELM